MTAGAPGAEGLSRDPRRAVTPDAFVVAERLLGMPLASPGRRLAAILIDLMVIGIVTAVTKSFALVLGVVASVLFIRAGFKRVAIPGSAFGRAMRASVGCLGIVVGGVTLILWTAFGIDLRGHDDAPRVVNVGSGPVQPDLATTVLGASSGISFARAPDLEAADEAGQRLVAVGRNLGLSDDELRELLSGLSEDAPWADGADSLITSLLLEVPASGSSVDVAPGDTSALAAVVGPGVDSGAARDSIDRLTAQVETLAEELRAVREAAEAEDEESGLVTWLRTVLDDLGFGFGWASLYMTGMLTWWKGQTVGKRLLGIRVVRLDGEPITWWTAFERAGGYVAGFATGLLGFAQVYWDANRQAIHDRIVGTVVVREGAPMITDWESSM